MNDLFKSRTYSEGDGNGGGYSKEKLDRDGKYLFLVEGAHDTWKVYQNDKPNPKGKTDEEKAGKNRRIVLRLRVLDAIRSTGNYEEADEDFESRRTQRGRVATVTVWVNAGSKSNRLEANFQVLATIAGAKDRPPTELLEKALVGTKEGSPIYNLDRLARELAFNCSALVGRRFIGVIQEADQKYPQLNPWGVWGIPEEEQKPWKGKVQQVDTLYSGQDFASEDHARWRAEQDAKYAENGNGGEASASRSRSASKPKPEPVEEVAYSEDDLPF
jgi:hypothetical protein